MALATTGSSASRLLNLCCAIILVSSLVLCKAQEEQPPLDPSKLSVTQTCPAEPTGQSDSGIDVDSPAGLPLHYSSGNGALSSSEAASEGSQEAVPVQQIPEGDFDPLFGGAPAASDQPPDLPTEAPPEDDRHNFADARDGAKLVAANREARKAAALLDSDGDTYLKNECKADKWVLFELSQVAKVEEIQISQFELYSSRVHTFELKGRQTHPRHDGVEYGKGLNLTQWWLLGQYNASNIKGTQAFRVTTPSWVKYIQLHFLTHHGSEPVCALNDVRVYGKSAADDLEDRLAMETSQDDSPAVTEPEAATAEPLIQANFSEPMPNDTANHTQVLSPPTAQPDPISASDAQPASPEPPAGPPLSPDSTALTPQQQQQQQQQPVALAPTVEVVTGPAAVAREAVILFPPTVGSDQESLQLPPGPLLLTAPGSQQSVEAALSSAGSLNTAPVVDARLPDSLPSNSAGSSKGKHGGSVYDLLIGEIKALKLQHKAYPRAIADLERNVSSAIAQLGDAVAALTAGVADLQTCAPQASFETVRQLAGLRTAGHAGHIALNQGYSKREAVLLGIAAMLAGLLLGSHSAASQQQHRSYLQQAVLGLALANGLAALALQVVEVWQEHWTWQHRLPP